MNTKTHEINFAGGTYDVQVEAYFQNGTPAIKVTDGHFPFATATVNLPDENHYLLEGEVFIKNYSENAGIFEALIEAGIVRDTGKTVNLGFVEVNIAEILV